jgi:formylglycine-generating enzyme
MELERIVALSHHRKLARALSTAQTRSGDQKDAPGQRSRTLSLARGLALALGLFASHCTDQRRPPHAIVAPTLAASQHNPGSAFDRSSPPGPVTKGPSRPPKGEEPGSPPRALAGQPPRPGTDSTTNAGAACPTDMQLVAGTYCSEVRQTCAKGWYDKNNKKNICERFTPPSECVGERSERRFCIDRYEWPNRAGQRPEVMNTFYQAQVKCAAVGKRLCTETEWTLACEGPELEPYPYGYERDPNKCNGDRPWGDPDLNKVARRDPNELARLWQGVPSGSQPECVSDYGVHDLPGNADEVVASENFTETWRGKYDSVTTGGPWYRGVRNQCRPKIYTHSEGFYYYYLSFRCCSEPDGKPTDPRSPKQLRAGTRFATVERLARFTTAEMRDKLQLIKSGTCTCPERDTLCKTMCGTLLGPEAKDAPKRPE